MLAVLAQRVGEGRVMGRLAKLTDLFEEGVVAPLKASDGSEVIVWLNKLSAFESEQAAHEGRIARARVMLAIKEIGTPEADLFALVSQDAKLDTLITALLDAKDNERTVKVIRELHSDKEWKDKLEVLEWSSEQIAAMAEDDPEVAVVSKVLGEYQGEIIKRVEYLRNEMRQELLALPEAKVREMHTESYAENVGIGAFIREQAKSQVFYSLRVCQATRDDSGRWRHTKCNHQTRWLDSRDEVDQLPESLLRQVRDAYEKLNMAPDVARFSEGPASSSESRGPSNKPGESKGSGPEATSEELVTTSS